MYKKILFCLDNSDCANTGVELGLRVAQAMRSSMAGCHVYAARLHNDRFRQMEGGLPPQYQTEEGLKKQREVHDSLITKGLRIISDSYAAPFIVKAQTLGIEASGVSREGKNFEELVAEAAEGAYDLVVLGAHGLGRVSTSRVGSVCERVVRRLRSDVLITREAAFEDGPITVCVDGSPASFGGLMTAFSLARVFGRPVEAIAAFDPEFHYSAFRAIAGVLTEEASRIFRFSEQEKLHEEIIDRGLERIYRLHLDEAVALGAEAGVEVSATLLSGKACHKIIEYARDRKPFLLVLGRTGAHASHSMDIGSATENCLRECACHILVSARQHVPVCSESHGPEWSAEAASVLDSIPSFARGMVKMMAEEAARKEGVEEITPLFMRKVRQQLGDR